MTTAALMLQGTGSDVGKSLLVAGLCRAARRRGLAVRPFKPQNMSNNAAVTVDGGEIGRAQALQARACGVEPVTAMNPVLLKPQTDIGAQVVVRGRMRGTARAGDYQALKPTLLAEVLEAFDEVGRGADLVFVEGAGSPAEVNLRQGDIANMGFAAAAGVPVVLVGDIDRGGVIASVVGTHVLLPPDDRRWLRGFLINKFRGDLRLFDDGVTAIEARTSLPCFGVVPYFADAARLPAEDSVVLERPRRPEDAPIKVAVPVLARIANFDDLDPLIAEPDVAVDFVRPGTPLPGDADLVVLPGSKSTRGDLDHLRAEGWDIDLAGHIRRGGAVIGLCGGYQMLGRRIADPDGIEGPPGTTDGLGYLDVETVLGGDKTLIRAEGLEVASGAAVSGYEMHVGRTTGAGLDRPMLRLADHADGAVSPDGRVGGCYLHGLFRSDGFRHAFLARLRARMDSGVRYDDDVDTVLDRLADHLEAHVRIDDLLALAGAPRYETASNPISSPAASRIPVAK